MLLVFLISCVVAGMLGPCKAGTQSVETNAGTFIGTSESITIKDKRLTVNTFLGIPYAEPPIGALRLKKTKLLDRVDSPYTADRFGPACRQVDIPGMSPIPSQSEDCLFLNIYVPEQTADREGGHAVMVFIHGGAFIVGAGQNYHGERLAVFGNVIVVTINYRLGLFGFVGTGDHEAPGNLGFWDQRTALQWVNNNIQGFGGDRSRVTIFGESAGGTSVLYHALYPQNEGLFQRMISQSGAPNANSALNKHPKSTFLFLAEKFGCKKSQLKDTVACIQEQDTETLMDTLTELMKLPENIPHLRFFPIIDGEFVKTHPSSLSDLSTTTEIDAVRFYRSIDTIIGCNSQEGAMFVAIPFVFYIEDPEKFLPTREEFETEIIPILVGMEFGPDTPDLIRSLFVSQYTDWDNPNSQESVRQQLLDVFGDLLFNIAAVEMSGLHANSTQSAPSFFYHLTATPSTPLLRRLSWLKGANHADDLTFVFGFKADLMAANQTFNKPLDWEYDLSYSMMTYWSNFAKTGNPNTPPPTDALLPTWPAYDVDKKQHINLDQDISVGHHLMAERVNFWLKVLPDVMKALADQKLVNNIKTDDYCTADGECGGP